MDSILHICEVLIAFVILNSHFQFCAISQSLNPQIHTASGFRSPLISNNTTRKDSIFQWSSSSIRLSTGGFSTTTSPGPFLNSSFSIPSNNRATLLSTSFQSLATPSPPTITPNSQSSLTVSSTTPFFIVPTVTSTLPIYLDTSVLQSSTVSPIILVTNPSDPSQTVPFKTLQIPESQRKGLPSVTNTTPAALLLLNFGFPVLLFSFYTIVFPAIPSLPSWLSLTQYPSIGAFNDPKSDPSQPSRSTQGTSTTSTSPSSSPSSTAVDWVVSTKTGTTEAQYNNLLLILSELNIKTSKTRLNSALDFQQFVATVNSSLASKIQEQSTVDVIIEDFDIANDDLEESLLVPNETISQKAKRVPMAYGRRDPNLNSSSATLRKRGTTAVEIEDSENFPQRAWLSRIERKVTQNYILDPVGGAGSFIYVIDTGIYWGHSVFTNPDLKIETHSMSGWSWPWPFSNNNDYSGHGTCVASIAYGTAGIMTKGTLVAVRVINDSGKVSIGDTWKAVEWVIGDVVRRGRRGRSVINLSRAIVPANHAMHYEISKQWKKLLENTTKNGIVVVCAAGNYHDRMKVKTINAYPQLLGVKMPLIVVGSHELDGKASSFSQTGPALTLFALGNNGNCADYSGANKFKVCSGTSCATPVVAGLVGYLMSLPSIREKYHLDDLNYQQSWAQDMKNEVITLAQQAGVSLGDEILIANNGVATFPLCNALPSKRDNIPGDTTLELNACTSQESTSSQGSSLYLSSTTTSGPLSSTSPGPKIRLSTHNTKMSSQDSSLLSPSTATSRSPFSGSTISTHTSTMASRYSSLLSPSTATSRSPFSGSTISTRTSTMASRYSSLLSLSTATSRSPSSGLTISTRTSPMSSQDSSLLSPGTIISRTISTHVVSTSTPIHSSSISCQQPRLPGAPLGDQLKSGLTTDNAIQVICQTSFTPQNNLTTTFNNVYYYISITRKTSNQTLQWCISSLNAIISSCIVNENFFGGLYSKGDELYNISNSGYPSNQDPLQIPLPSSTSLSSSALAPSDSQVSSSRITTTSSVYPSTTVPAGFHIIGYTSSGIYSDASLGVVGSANDNCGSIIDNQDKYGAYGFLGNGSDGEGISMYPNYVNSSTAQFYLLSKGAPIDTDSSGLPLCGVKSPKNFRLSFFSTWATNGPGSFGFQDSSGTTGTCIFNQSTESCQDYGGRTYQVTDLMTCEADGNPSYCASH